MTENNVFFDNQSEQSAVKAKIVGSYFSAWEKVITNHWDASIPMGYIDLYCGPGMYADGKKSVPLMLVEKAVLEPKLNKRIVFLFNDENDQNIISLQNEINKIPGINSLKFPIQYFNKTIDQRTALGLRFLNEMPILSFVDPFGYKGLSMKLINKLISNNGSDCIFFFNYNRINMALSSNTKVDKYLIDIFGKTCMEDLKAKLPDMSPAERELLIINTLVSVLRKNGNNQVLPFKFYSANVKRTSHYIVFVTKHPMGCKIMKEIMYANSAKDIDGIATFEFRDTNNFSQYLEISMFDRPLNDLCLEIIEHNKGKTVKVLDIVNRYIYNCSNPFISKNIKDALKRLENESKIKVINGRTQKFRKGILNMPDNAIIKFLE